MAVPKRKTSKARKRRRFAYWKAEAPRTIRCRSCGGLRQPHVACPYCGTYKDQQVMAPRATEID
ncbi:MAG TPA: 50S ribosomal protein L32 [Armatimonadetes bacterium]|nr:50S ribosomal protein L32 [Armatimonadota bacterium]